MRMQIDSATEFFERVGPLDLDLRSAGSDADPSEPLEVLLAPGDYADANLRLGDRLAERQRDIVLRGADADKPTVLSGASLAIAGRRVLVENVLLRQRVDHLPAVSIAANESVTLVRCAIVDCQVRQPPGGRVVEISAANPGGPTRVLVSDTWFIRNWAPAGQTLFACETDPPGYVDTLRFERVGFVDNFAAVAIAPHATQALELDHCLFLAPEAHPEVDSDLEPRLAAITSAGTRVSVKGVLIALADFHAVPDTWLVDVSRQTQPLPDRLRVELIERCIEAAERGAPPDPALFRALL
jgi:hypothetical protein